MATTIFEKPMGTEVETLKSDKQSKSDSTLTTSNKTVVGSINELNQAIANVQNGLAYIVGNTNTTGSTITVGQFVYVKGHSTIAEGLRKVTASISANGNITTSNTSACSDGGLNALNSNVTALSDQIATRAIAFSPTGTGTTNSVGQMDINTGLELIGKRVMALSNYASSLGMQYGVYAESWTYNGLVTCRVRKLSDGTAIINTDLPLGNIMLLIL